MRRIGLMAAVAALALRGQDGDGVIFPEAANRGISAPPLPSEIRALGEAIVCPPGSSGQVKHPLPLPDVPNGSVHDEPPTGGEGSFRMSLGNLAYRDRNGTWVTHSHRERHMLWVIDSSKRERNVFERRTFVMAPDAAIEVDMERRTRRNGQFTAAGTIRLEQDTYQGYAFLAMKNHKVPCDEDYVWKVSTRGDVDLETARQGFQVAEGEGEKVRIARMRIWANGKHRPATRTLEMRSGCAAFQITSRWNWPQSMTSNCKSRGWRSARD